MARERSSGQFEKSEWLVSTPTVPGYGIDEEFNTTTQEHFFFPCPSCGRHIELLFENLVVTAEDIRDVSIRDSHYICLECKMRLPSSVSPTNKADDAKCEWLAPGVWVPASQTADPDNRGFYVNQMYSPTITPVEMATAVIQSRTNKAVEQELHNSKFGNAHECEGARVTNEVFESCIHVGYTKRSNNWPGRLMTMGVDVGSDLHVEIDAWTLEPGYVTDVNVHAKAALVWEGKKKNFGELDDLMRQYRINYCVCDIFPERREATKFARRFRGYVALCFYAKGMSGKALQPPGKDPEDEFKINVDRTYWLDTSLGRFHNKTIMLPTDVSAEYKGHVRNIGRTFVENDDGLVVSRYVTTGGEDHFAHSRNYSEIALALAVNIQSNRDAT
ncbi:MAG: hypothetical protein HC888_07445 [Candidatus Competibacteraceae bacterium]|nr:hypothetical protein [Candidatus Competibacteraceae bacterium]